MKHVTLCADDYGQNALISQAIIKLIQKNRVAAVSCLTTFNNWPQYAQEIQKFKEHIDIGLHLNLTEGDSLSGEPFSRLPNLIVNCYLGKSINFSSQKIAQRIEQELNLQLDHFIDGVGCLPDFIDGHQHIHQLPIIREIICKIYNSRLRQKNAYIRSTYTPITSLAFKSFIISSLGAKSLKKMLHQNNIPMNPSFAGAYSFHPRVSYEKIFPLFLKKIKDKGIIMCHPGLMPPTQSNDSIASARYKEYQYFNSVQFLKDCNHHNVIIRRLSPFNDGN